MIIFDEEIGKIEAIASSEEVSAGALIHYYRYQKGSLMILQECDVVNVPFEIAQKDILFLHHVLEICYFSLPFGSRNEEIFQLLLALFYEPPLACDTMLFKIVFVFKLLVMLGMHPDEPTFQKPYYFILARESIDTIMEKSIHLNIKNVLHEWIQCCLHAHPLIHSFKTIHFLDSDRLFV